MWQEVQPFEGNLLILFYETHDTVSAFCPLAMNQVDQLSVTGLSNVDAIYA